MKFEDKISKIKNLSEDIIHNFADQLNWEYV